MDNCIFCKILSGVVPCAQVYADAHALAFLDIGPFEKGHALVIPRLHAVTLLELPEVEAAALGVAIRRVGGLLLSRLPCDGFNVLQSNGACATQVVPHVHFHVIPRWNGRAMNWISGMYDNAAEMTAIAARLRGA
jgi:histidine triad (HIT) family protein